MDELKDKNYQTAKELIDQFLSRTGIIDQRGSPSQRYLWTDAFAVQCCYALSREPSSEDYGAHAVKLIELVHSVLGTYRDDDSKTGWVSGMDKEEGKKHPTAGGLRIGKKLPERMNGEPLNRSLEWERDGQYFHYLTRWFNALLQAFTETGDKKYAIYAAELIKAGEKFISQDRGTIGMFWKMNSDLTRPVIESMGAHDPLEGLVCVISAMDSVPEACPALKPFKNYLEALCQDMNWFTTDSLGIGGLLLNAARSSELSTNKKVLPPSIRPGYLFADSIAGLQAFSKQIYNGMQSAESRLPFRECGLSLGIRVLYGLRDKHQSNNVNNDIDFNELGKYLYLVEDIEEFWSRPSNQQSSTWAEHQDINSVTLASSLLAARHPQVFCASDRS